MISSQSSPSLSRGGGPPGAAGWWRGRRDRAAAAIVSRAAEWSRNTSLAEIRSVAIPSAANQASRFSSRVGRSPMPVTERLRLRLRSCPPATHRPVVRPMINLILTGVFVVVFFAIRMAINDAAYHAREQRRAKRRR